MVQTTNSLSPTTPQCALTMETSETGKCAKCIGRDDPCLHSISIQKSKESNEHAPEIINVLEFTPQTTFHPGDQLTSGVYGQTTIDGKTVISKCATAAITAWSEEVPWGDMEATLKLLRNILAQQKDTATQGSANDTGNRPTKRSTTSPLTHDDLVIALEKAREKTQRKHKY